MVSAGPDDQRVPGHSSAMATGVGDRLDGAGEHCAGPVSRCR